MGTSYLSRLWFGFILTEDEFEIYEEIYEEIDSGNWSAVGCTLDEKSRGSGYKHDEVVEVYVYVIETFRECDERDEWAKSIELPVSTKLEQARWANQLQKFCEEKKVKYKQPSWYLTVECW